MTEAVAQTLLWVNEELASTLAEARQALETYMERPENTGPLKACADLMHEAAGALMMVEVQGGALLAEEVEQVARRLLDAPADARARGEALEALSRAMVQLPSYMERVVNGGRDIPLILLPLLNDLRAVRGQALLSENTLLLLNLPAERRLKLQRPGDRPATDIDVRALARQLRPRFQAALLGWIRGDRPDSSLAVMADVIAALEDACLSDRAYQLWWIAAGVVEALRQQGLEANAAVKRMLGQVDFELRRLADDGERAIDGNPPVALLNSLLFYAARSTTRGRRVSAIRQTFSLGDLIPGEDELESARDSLSAPSVRLMQTVGGAIREDLARVKDVLDIFVRTGMTRLEEIEPQVELMKKIGDTLGVLGLPGLQGVIQEQADMLRTLVAGERAPDEDALLLTAARLIEVEDNIERQLVRMITEEGSAPLDADDLDALESRRDFDDVTATVLRECNVNLARVKEAIVQTLEAPLEPQVLDEVPRLLRSITAGLLMLDRTRAVALVERIGAQIRDWLSIGAEPPPDEALDRLADAIVSLEYYMETIAGGRSDPMYMLDNSESCLAALDRLARDRGAARAMPETVEVAATVVIPPPFPREDEAAAPARAAEEARIGPEAGEVDPELLELFIEEAGEVAASMRELLPAWECTPPDEAASANLRRLFHTLKGSGRMVGAERIGEFAWHIENVLNRVLDGRLERSDEIAGLVKEAVGRVPGLIEQLETGRAPADDAAALVAQAQAIADGRVEAPAPVEAPPPDEMDPVLREIFTKEAAEHLAAIHRYLEQRRDRSAPHVITEELYRACHTLAGSANMAGVEPAVALARPLDRLVRGLHDDGVGMTDAVLALCGAAAELYGRIIDAVREGAVPEVDVGELAAALQREHAEHAKKADAAVDFEAPARPAGVPPRPAEPTVEAAPAALDLDPEIAAIFREEADEILERCDEVLEVWRTDTTARQPLDELQRQLHTLKGGARLAGLHTMGDFSHALEDLVIGLLRGADGERSFALVRRCIDELHRMRDGIERGLAVPASASLVEELAGGVESAPEALEPEALEPEMLEPEMLEPEMLEPEMLEPEMLEPEMLEPEGAEHETPVREAADLPPDLVVEASAADELPTVDFDLTGADAGVSGPFDEGLAAGIPDELGWTRPDAEAPERPLARARPWTEGPPPAAAAQQKAVGWPPPAPPALAPEAAEAGEYEGVPELIDVVGPEAFAAAEAFGEPAEWPELTESAVASEDAGPVEPPAPEVPVEPVGADEFEEGLEPAALADAVEPAAFAEPGAVDEEPGETWASTVVIERAGEIEPTIVLGPGGIDRALEEPEPAEPPGLEEPVEPVEPVEPFEATVVLEPARPGVEAPAEPAADEAATGAATPAAAPVRPAAPIGIPAAAAAGTTPSMPAIAAASPSLSGRAELVRVDAELLESLLNNAGEVSIYRSRLEQQIGSIDFNLDELSQTVVRLREQLRKLEMEADARVHRAAPSPVRGGRPGFDALEMERYSVIQQLSRALAETASDVSSLQQAMGDLVRDADTLMTQQQRVISELQDGLMRTRMVPFSRHVQRLNRIVRQAAREAGKEAELQVTGGDNELDRQVMDRMLGPFEHLLRNAIVHGIEAPAARAGLGKPATGRVGIELRRDGAEMRIVVSDDGGGLDLEAIRRKAETLGYLAPDAPLDEDAAAELIFRPGFSTAMELTLVAGRGVGMDVVANEIRQLGGSLRVESDRGRGLRFVIRLPYTRAITQALVMRAGEELFALPLPTVEGIARVHARDIGRHLGENAEPLEYGGQGYRVRHLASIVDGQARPLPADDSYVPVVLVRAGEHSTALLGDEMLGAREIVVKTLGPQFAGVPGIAGATVLGDGNIVIILDVGALVRVPPEAVPDLPVEGTEDTRDDRTFVMVVDDSITVRRVTERLLERNGMRVVTAKDGMDAVSLLREHRPDIILLDIEMPRMDGFEVASHVRNDPRLKHIPIVMITSRVGQKHRARAIETGVDDYLGKPYQEHQLLAAIGALVEDRQAAGGDR